MLALSLKMTRRDWRAGELRFLLIALMIAVASLSSVGFFVDRMRNGLNRDAHQLLGADLLVSTARQILLYRALGLTPPNFFHCELMLDDSGQRLAKRHDALSLRTLRGQGKTPDKLREDFYPPSPKAQK